MSNNHAEYAGRSILLLNGKFTGGLGLTEIQSNEESLVRVTNLERTLIDVAVRPHYAGGVASVVDAYKRAGTKISVPRIKELLDKLAYMYPYHQAIGFYLEETRRFSDHDLAPLRELQMHFDFYLTHQMNNAEYSERWRVYHPKPAERS